MTVAAHRILFLVPFRCAASAGPPPRGWTEVPASAKARHFLTPEALDRLYGRRIQPKDAVRLEGADVRLVHVLLPRPSVPTIGCAAVVVDAEEPSLATIFSLADDARRLAPEWEGQPMGRWSFGSTRGDLAAVMRALVPGLEGFLLGGTRALTWTCIVRGDVPQDRDWRWRAVATDPAGMAPPDAAWREERMAAHAVRRWASTGVEHAFTSYGGGSTAACRSVGATPPSWLAPLFDDVYADVGLWVACVAAAREVALAQALAEPRVALDPSRKAWVTHVAAWEHPRLTEQDQGRELARAWLGAIESDRGDLTLLRELAR